MEDPDASSIKAKEKKETTGTDLGFYLGEGSFGVGPPMLAERGPTGGHAGGEERPLLALAFLHPTAVRSVLGVDLRIGASALEHDVARIAVQELQRDRKAVLVVAAGGAQRLHGAAGSRLRLTGTAHRLGLFFLFLFFFSPATQLQQPDPPPLYWTPPVGSSIMGPSLSTRSVVVVVLLVMA